MWYFKLSVVRTILVYMNRCVSGRMDEWMDGWMNGWMDIDECMDRWMRGWQDGWMDGWMDVNGYQLWPLIAGYFAFY